MVKEKYEYVGEYKGYEYGVMINRVLGVRCGYVVADEFRGKDYTELDIDCHGGLTFSGEIDGEYQIGFDCAHLGDGQDIELMKEPYKELHGQVEMFLTPTKKAKSKEYVIRECKNIIDQLWEMNENRS